MIRCDRCKADVALGSGFCPRCGAAIDDGLGRRQLYRRVVAAVVLGVLSLMVLASLFIAKKRSPPATTPSTEVRKL